MTNFDKFRYELKMHFKNNFWVYFFILFGMVVGLILGVVLGLSDDSYMDLLSSDNNNLFDYVNGEAKLGNIFFKRLLNICLLLIVFFLTNLSIYTSFIAIILLSYQCVILVLSCFALITTFGFSGVINCLLLVIPINLLNLGIMAFFCSACMSRAFVARKFKMNFKDSCRYVNYSYTTMIALILLFIMCIINAIIVPLLLKSFIIVSF